MKFLIIGGDAAGMSAASRAKRNNPDLSITVLEKTRDVSYSACGMPYNIADPDREIDDLVVRSADAFRKKQEIDLLLDHKAESINPHDRIVTGTTSEGENVKFTYDKLLLATGGSPIIPDLPGVHLPGVKALKSLDDGRKIKSYIQDNNVKKVVIMGMGYIGLEMCEALDALGIEVAMVKPGPEFLPWMAQELSQVVQKEVADNHIQLNMGQKIKKIDATGQRLQIIGPDISMEADMVLIAMGIRPNNELAKSAGLELGAGEAIAVDTSLKTSDDHIYAAGDCADAYHVVTNEKTWIPLALRANRAGWAVADNILGKKTQLPGVVGTAVFKVFNLQVARTGLNMKQAANAGFNPAQVVIQTRSRAHAHPGSSVIWVQMVGDKKSGRLLGAQMVGKDGVAHRINAAAVALHAQLTVDRFCQADLAYAPPFGPVWDPLLTAANQLLKKL